MEDLDESYQIQSVIDSSIDGGVCNNHLSTTTSSDIASLYGQASEDCSINDKHTIYTDSVNHPVPTLRTDLNQDTVKVVLQENINIDVSSYKSICQTNLDSSQKKCNDQVIKEIDTDDLYAEYANILDHNLNENEISFSQGYGHEQLPIQTDRTLEGIQLQDSNRIHGHDGQGKLYGTFPYCHKKGPDHVNGSSGLHGQKDESGVPVNIGSAGAAGDQDQPVHLSRDGATGLESFTGKVEPKQNFIVEGQSGETGRCGLPGNLESTRDTGEAVLSGLHGLMGQIAGLSREIATWLKSFTGKVIKPIQNIKVEGHPGETGRFGLPGMFRSPDDASEIGDNGLSELPGSEGEVEDSDQVENGFTGPKRLTGAVLKEQKGVQEETTKPLNTLPFGKVKESRKQGKSGVFVLTGIHDLKGLLLLVILSSGFITSSAKCILTKHVTGSDQNIAIQVCHSTECDGTERWDRSKGSNLEHIYIENALGESKLSDRYTLERNDNCSILSIENVTKEDIFDATYQFVIGTSDKIPIQLKHELIIYKTDDGDPVKCNGDITRLTINMTVLHIKKHPSFKCYTERENFTENLTVSHSLEKMGLWFVTTIYSVIDIRETNFNETLYLVYKDTKDVIIFDKSVICIESKVAVESISKDNKTSVVVPIVIVLCIIMVLCVFFGWYFRKEISQYCRGGSFHNSKDNSDQQVNGEGKSLMNTTGLQNESVLAMSAENQNKSESNGKMVDEAKFPSTEQVNLQLG